ncbi:MAG: O-antigen ligase family protein [Burkholderiales bacterium]|nr:O-antigen ligase family protein [Burkholderiales bacterium]
MPEAGVSRYSTAIGCASAALLAIALLLPVGDQPWLSFWREWTSAVAALAWLQSVLTALRDTNRAVSWPLWSMPTAALALAGVAWMQWGLGQVPYLSDALLPSLYFASFAIAVVVTASLPDAERATFADRLAVAFLIAALASSPLAILQWLGWSRLDFAERVPGGRPIAHMEQANLLASLLIQGLCAIWRLRYRERIGHRVAMALASPIAMALVLTQSRVAWLVTSALLVLIAWRRELLPWRARNTRALAAIAVTVALAMLATPWFASHTGLQSAPLADRLSEGRRPAIWALFLDAVAQRPWGGWGVLQNGAAQFAMADRHPSLGYFYASTHDYVIDLVVWFGVPLGLAAGLSLAGAVALRLGRARDAATLSTAFAAAALLLHGLVELPLFYLYFLLPFGMLLGLSAPRDACAPAMRLRTSSPALFRVPAIAVTLVLAALARDYIALTDVRPAYTVERRSGHDWLYVESAPPPALLLDQLRAFHRFASWSIDSPAIPDLVAARTTMLRYPVAPVIEHYARLTGAHGDSAAALDALHRLCKFEPEHACTTSHTAWAIWRRIWPVLPDWPPQVGSPPG